MKCDPQPAIEGIHADAAGSGKPLRELSERTLRMGIRGVLRSIAVEADDHDLRLLAVRGCELVTELESRAKPPLPTGRRFGAGKARRNHS